MEVKKYRIQIKFLAEAVYYKEVEFFNLSEADEYAAKAIEEELYGDWEFDIFEGNDAGCRIYELN